MTGPEHEHSNDDLAALAEVDRDAESIAKLGTLLTGTLEDLPEARFLANQLDLSPVYIRHRVSQEKRRRKTRADAERLPPAVAELDPAEIGAEALIAHLKARGVTEVDSITSLAKRFRLSHVYTRQLVTEAGLTTPYRRPRRPTSGRES